MKYILNVADDDLHNWVYKVETIILACVFAIINCIGGIIVAFTKEGEVPATIVFITSIAVAILNVIVYYTLDNISDKPKELLNTLVTFAIFVAIVWSFGFDSSLHTVRVILGIIMVALLFVYLIAIVRVNKQSVKLYDKYEYVIESAYYKNTDSNTSMTQMFNQARYNSYKYIDSMKKYGMLKDGFIDTMGRLHTNNILFKRKEVVIGAYDKKYRIPFDKCNIWIRNKESGEETIIKAGE